MHAVAKYALISQRMMLVEMRGKRNKTRHEGPEGALLFLRATSQSAHDQAYSPLDMPYANSNFWEDAICRAPFCGLCNMPIAYMQYLAWLANFPAFIELFSIILSLPVAFLARRKGRPAGKGLAARAWPARY
jgi:hypothetical protein